MQSLIVFPCLLPLLISFCLCSVLSLVRRFLWLPALSADAIAIAIAVARIGSMCVRVCVCYRCVLVSSFMANILDFYCVRSQVKLLKIYL